MVHKPKHKVHSFRGLLGNGGQDEIELERQNMNVAFRVIKFEIMPYAPATQANESVVKVYKEEPDAIDATIDFTDPNLLATAIFFSEGNTYYPSDFFAVFDLDLFSRNIFVTHSDTQTNSCNYYLELEEVPVGAATLMQIKLGTARKLISAKMGG